MFDEPKPCPFCGGKNPIVVKDVQYPDTPYTRTWYAIECNLCDATGDWDLGESGALEKWNTRPGEDALQENIVKWIEANNAATALINEQQAKIARLRVVLQAVYDEFTWDYDARAYITKNVLNLVTKALEET